MSSEELCFLPASQLAPMLRSGDLSPTELCQAVLDRAEALEPALNAFVVLDGDGAMDQARAVEAKMAKGEAVGPLAGIPVTIKDLAVTADLPTQRGSHSMKGEVFGTDTPFVSRLRQAGAIVLCLLYTSPSPRD